MINKVKPPIALTLIHSSKQAKNDLGGQSAESYSQNPSKDESPEKPQDDKPAEPVEVASIEDQVGLTNVLTDWLEVGKATNGMSRQKMSQKYQGESAPAKGMLLNKKIS